MADPLQDLLAAASALARRREDVRLVLEVAGRRVEVNIGKAQTVPAGPFSEMEECILEALGAETMTGQEIADKAGYPYGAGMRTALASLRRRGILGGAPGNRGYFVTPR
jgi:hypothetical protein